MSLNSTTINSKQTPNFFKKLINSVNSGIEEGAKQALLNANTEREQQKVRNILHRMSIPTNI